MKSYTFAQVAKMECAECTTTITTTLLNRYVRSRDVEEMKEGARDEVSDLLFQAGLTVKIFTSNEIGELADRIIAAIFEEE